MLELNLRNLNYTENKVLSHPSSQYQPFYSAALEDLVRVVHGHEKTYMPWVHWHQCPRLQQMALPAWLVIELGVKKT